MVRIPTNPHEDPNDFDQMDDAALD